jgi:predicted  nucleic acid-binding Zn-ribbon protein
MACRAPHAGRRVIRRPRKRSAASGRATIAQEAERRLSTHGCPECGQRFHLNHPRQLFCKPQHKKDWESIARTRGLQYYAVALVQRQTRNGTRGDKETGRKANAEADMLRLRWREEDKAAGRMSAVDFLRLRYLHGYDRP